MAKGPLHIEEVALEVFGDQKDAVWTKPTIAVEKGSVTVVKRCSVRIAAPLEFRKHFSPTDRDKPSSVVASLAQWTSVSS